LPILYSHWEFCFLFSWRCTTLSWSTSNRFNPYQSCKELGRAFLCILLTLLWFLEVNLNVLLTYDHAIRQQAICGENLCA